MGKHTIAWVGAAAFFSAWAPAMAMGGSHAAILVHPTADTSPITLQRTALGRNYTECSANLIRNVLSKTAWKNLRLQAMHSQLHSVTIDAADPASPGSKVQISTYENWNEPGCSLSNGGWGEDLSVEKDGKEVLKLKGSSNSPSFRISQIDPDGQKLPDVFGSWNDRKPTARFLVPNVSNPDFYNCVRTLARKTLDQTKWKGLVLGSRDQMSAFGLWSSIPAFNPMMPNTPYRIHVTTNWLSPRCQYATGEGAVLRVEENKYDVLRVNRSQSRPGYYRVTQVDPGY